MENNPLMAIFLRTAITVLAIFLNACDTVSSPVPLGVEPAVIDAAEWSGQWFNADGRVDITVVDAAKGLVHIDFREDGKADTLDLQLRKFNGWIFASVSEQAFDQSQGLEGASSETESYLWARLVRHGKTIIAWIPKAEKFATLVEKGLLPGRVEDDNVILGPLNQEHYRILTSEDHGVLLDWEHPTVLYRVKDGNKSD